MKGYKNWCTTCTPESGRKKKTMEDVITEVPPPSRFFPEDLDNFVAPLPPLPSPFLFLSRPDLRPRLLVIAISPSHHLQLHRLSPKNLVGSLFLPDMPLAGNHLNPSPQDSGCSIFAAGENALLVSFQYLAPAERARSVAKVFLGGVSADEVLILDSVRSGCFRGRLSADNFLEFKLETSAKKAVGSFPALRQVPYYPTGSVADGLGAALLAECQMRRLKGTLCLTWNEDNRGFSSSIENLFRDLLPELVISLGCKGAARVSGAESDLYV